MYAHKAKKKIKHYELRTEMANMKEPKCFNHKFKYATEVQ